MSKNIQFRLQRTPDGWYGTAVLPMAPGADQLAPNVVKPGATKLVVKSKKPAASKDAAISDAARLASKALDNPVIQTLMPPGVGPALKGIMAIANNGTVRKMVSEGGKAAWRALKSLF